MNQGPYVCSICLTDSEKGEEPNGMWCAFPCGHVACCNCISRWLNTKRECPLCKRAVPDGFVRSDGRTLFAGPDGNAILERIQPPQNPFHWMDTALHRAARNHDPDGAAAFEQIMRSGIVDVNAVDRYGNTAMHYAAENEVRGPAMVRMLIDSGVDISDSLGPGHDGTTPLHRAAKHVGQPWVGVFGDLLGISREHVNAVDIYGNTVWDYAAGNRVRGPAMLRMLRVENSG